MFALQLYNLNPDPSSAANSLSDLDQENAYLTSVSKSIKFGNETK